MKEEPTISVPLRLFKNLIDCLEAQKTLSSTSLEDVVRKQIQNLIDDNKEWAKEVLESIGEKTQTVTDLQETLDFVKNERRIKAKSSLCDNEEESGICSISVVEPDDGEQSFY